jgi:hypothetical protein
MERAVDEFMAMPRDVSREHANLAIGDLARRPRMLTRHAARRLALLQEPGHVHSNNVINDAPIAESPARV